MKTTPHIRGQSDNQWATGCSHCSYGIVSAPPRSGASELYLERLVQAIDDDIQFCTCKAGTRYRAYLLNRFEAMKREAKRDARMSHFADRGTHPDIEAARKAMSGGYEYVKAPPMRFVVASQPVERTP